MLKGKVVWILGILLLLALALAYSQYQRAERYKSEAEAANRNVASLSSTIESKDNVISQFEKAANDAIAIAEKQKATLAAATKQIDQFKRDLAETRLALQLKEEADHAIPECERFLASDWRVCPGHASAMLQRADDSVQGPDSDGAAASGGENPGGTDTGLRASLQLDPDSLGLDTREPRL